MAERKEVMAMVDEASQAVDSIGTEGLGGLLILAALLTEFKLAEVIGAEAKKIKAATHYTTSCHGESAMNDLEKINKSVADVLHEVCCIERQVNRKIWHGRRMMNNVDPSETEE
ncbi:hypothetical protein H0266_07570 [Halobacillus locisalis]|uniref:Uncharacterized protein n=1 Tax=Halobacillus locisalis TaxID=220753 RepID=A0A838CS98_9BACI|nr:hypothetical protein [Halobacillus locisalis]MBA2174748.1 hypothetical protein [Halobacillus locisalis]